MTLLADIFQYQLSYSRMLRCKMPRHFNLMTMSILDLLLKLQVLSECFELDCDFFLL